MSDDIEICLGLWSDISRAILSWRRSDVRMSTVFPREDQPDDIVLNQVTRFITAFKRDNLRDVPDSVLPHGSHVLIEWNKGDRCVVADLYGGNKMTREVFVDKKAQGSADFIEVGYGGVYVDKSQFEWLIHMGSFFSIC